MVSPQKIGIVIPCYNEADRLPLLAFEQYIAHETHHTLCFVNDGSKDATLQVIRSIADKFPQQVIILDNPQNMGKAETVRHGMLTLANRNEFDIIGFVDADLATPLHEIKRIIPVFDNPQKLIVSGSRIMHMGGGIHRKFVRFVLGRMFATVVSNWILKTPIYDTQCGFKFFRSSVIPLLFKDPFTSKWFFDIELFCRAIQYHTKVDINIIAQEFFLSQWNDIKGSKIKLSDYFKVPLELIKLKRHYQL